MASRSRRTARTGKAGGARGSKPRRVDPQGLFDAFIEAQRPQVEAALLRVLPDSRRSPRDIHRAMKYMVVPGGKRLRPLMVVLAHRTFGGEHPLIYEAAATVELIHTFSLIHDDLPCMDDDDYRRGRYSCHKAFGEATAVLAGDALLVLAFQILGRIGNDGTGSRLVTAVSDAIGTRGVIGGQCLDLESEGKRVSEKTLANIHARKTSALFVSCLVLGGLMAEATESALRSLASYGLAFGHAFQVADDLLNVEGEWRDLGRPRGGDIVQQKATYPRIVGKKKTRELLQRLIHRAVRCGGDFGDWAAHYQGLAFKVARRVPSWTQDMEQGIT
jgi:geranylgeranyl pyrophosphate synthase